MNQYHQITASERILIALLRWQGFSQADIARALGRHRSSIHRECRRNLSERGIYESEKAIERARARRSRARKGSQFTDEDLEPVWELLERKYSPEQISNTLKLEGGLKISHETIYKFIWQDKQNGGTLYKYLRQSSKQRRKRHRTYDRRGRMTGKRPLEARPAGARNRSRKGHFEADTVLGKGSKACLLTMVDRKTGKGHIQKMKNRTTRESNLAVEEIIKKENGRLKTITADNGTEFHQYKQIERDFDVKWYFAKPYHSWERGSNENWNGLVRQYFPKHLSLAKVTQEECNWVANELNERPRKRYDFKSPNEMHD
jgi:IS30 family transposase